MTPHARILNGAVAADVAQFDPAGEREHVVPGEPVGRVRDRHVDRVAGFQSAVEAQRAGADFRVAGRAIDLQARAAVRRAGVKAVVHAAREIAIEGPVRDEPEARGWFRGGRPGRATRERDQPQPHRATEVAEPGAD
jgi:hypothetical protein